MMECAYEGLEDNLAAEKPSTVQKVISFFREGLFCGAHEGYRCTRGGSYCYYRSLDPPGDPTCTIGRTIEEIREDVLRNFEKRIEKQLK